MNQHRCINGPARRRLLRQRWDQVAWRLFMLATLACLPLPARTETGDVWIDPSTGLRTVDMGPPSTGGSAGGNSRSSVVYIPGPSPAELDRRQRSEQAAALWQQGNEAWNHRDWAAAIYFNEQAAKIYPEHEGYAKNVEIARDNQRLDEARALARQGAEAWQQRDWAAAILHYQQAAAKDPGFAGYAANVEKARKNQRIERAREWARLATAAWRQGDWDTAIRYYQQAAELCPEESAYPENIAKARQNQKIAVAEIPLRRTWHEATLASRQKDYATALRLYAQAQGLKDSAELEKNIGLTLLAMHTQAVEAAYDRQDYPAALQHSLQAQALRNSPALEQNIRELRNWIGRVYPQGVPWQQAGLTYRLEEVGHVDKADALFRLRVEKAFGDRQPTGLQDLRDQSGFVFDQGRGGSPAARPYVSVPRGGLTEAVAVAKAALVMPRTAIEQPAPPAVVAQNPRLQHHAANQSRAAAELEQALTDRRGLFLQGPQASPEAWKQNSAKISELTYKAAVENHQALNAGGKNAFDADFDTEEQKITPAAPPPPPPKPPQD